MVDLTEITDDQFDRASLLRDIIEAHVTGSNDPFDFQKAFIECRFNKPTDFIAHDKANSTVTEDEWLMIKAAVTAGFSEEEQRVLAANIHTLSDLDKFLRDMTKKQLGQRSKILRIR